MVSELRVSAEANVLGRSSGVDGCKFWGGLAASSEVGGPVAAKRLLGAEDEVAENGFDAINPAPLVEKGFADEEEDKGFAPNRASPMLTAGFAGCFSALGSIFVFSFLSFAISEILTPRNALTLPSLRLHIFRRHDSTYSRLSCPGKNSGRSPFSWSRRTMRSLHTLHFARVAEGVMEGSSHS